MPRNVQVHLATANHRHIPKAVFRLRQGLGRDRRASLATALQNPHRLAMAETPVATYEQDLKFAQSVLSVNSTAAADLRQRYHGRIVSVLCSRGATNTEAEDLAADLWSDCFQARPDRPALLSKYQGRCALESWLMTVATNRLVDLKRRQSFRVDVSTSDQSSTDFFEQQPQPEAPSTEESLLKLLRVAIRNAFEKQESESVLMLKLIHLYQLTQREIARMWGWHESKVSRALEIARQHISRDILADLKRMDPWLELRWEDFLELCSGSVDGLFQTGEDNSQDTRSDKSKNTRSN